MLFAALLFVLHASPTREPSPPPPPPPLVESSSEEEPPPVESSGEVQRKTGPAWRPMWGLGISGAAIGYFGWLVGIVGWFASINCTSSGFFGATLTCTSTSPWLWLPLLGPWVALATGGTAGGWIPATVMLGLSQLGGLVMAIAGFSIKVPIIEEVSFSVTPSGSGIALGGVF